MSDQSRWSSSRVSQAPPARPSSSGTQQSRWATTSSPTPASPSTGSTPSSSASWRSRTNDGSASSSSSSNSTWRTPRQDASQSNAARLGSAGSRWASTPRSAPVEQDSVSHLADTISKTSLRSQLPSISIHSSSQSTTHPPPVIRKDGLTVRSTTRPLGGKSLDRLALLASPSRGLDSTTSLSTDLSAQGSMDLTLPSVQLELREYISARILKAIPLLDAPVPLRVLSSKQYLPTEEKTVVGAGEEELQQILLLVRKLREALVASKRVDGFAVGVYQVSVVLAVLCGDLPQLSSSLPRLVVELYPNNAVNDSEADDVHQLATHLGLHHSAKGADSRKRMVSLHLLQTLCLAGRATRLGQYSSDTGVLEPLHRGLKEYRMLREKLLQLYGDLDEHLQLCDTVYTALRDVDSFALSRLLENQDGGEDKGYRLDAWQRLVLLQAVPVVRNAAWAVAKKAYLYLPIGGNVKELIEGGSPQEQEDVERSQGETFLGELLLLSTSILPADSSKSSARADGEGMQKETPDEWDADDGPAPDTPVRNEHQNEDDRRLHAFLTLQFGTTLPSRLTALKQGYAVKLR